jgi:excisionase family DNA binding protein
MIDSSHPSTLMTVGDVADLLRTTPKAVYNMRYRGEIPGAVKIGSRLRFRREAVLEWVGRASLSSGAGR